jgi:hypothetical protein
MKEVICMSEKKVKPTVKKLATTMAGTPAAAKKRTTKAKAVTTANNAVVETPAKKRRPANKPPAKKIAEKPTATADPKKSKIHAMKNAATPAADNQAMKMKPTVAMAKRAASQKTAAKPTAEERYRMVEVAAYFIAERHGFDGRPDEHWAAAEREIACKLDT